jgi:hypothetical protein
MRDTEERDWARYRADVRRRSVRTIVLIVLAVIVFYVLAEAVWDDPPSGEPVYTDQIPMGS